MTGDVFLRAPVSQPLVGDLLGGGMVWLTVSVAGTGGRSHASAGNAASNETASDEATDADTRAAIAALNSIN